MKRNLEKFAASSAPKRISGTSLSVLHGERPALIVDFKTTLPWPAKPPPPSLASKPLAPRHVRKPVHAVEDSDFDEYVACVDVKEQVCAVENPSPKDKLLAVMLLNGHRVPLQLDTGATVNIVPEESFKEVYGEGSLSLLDNADVTLVMYNRIEEKPIGKKGTQVMNPRNGRKYSVEFVVVKGKGKPQLGLRASEQMQLISVVRQNIMTIQSEEPS